MTQIREYGLPKVNGVGTPGRPVESDSLRQLIAIFLKRMVEGDVWLIRHPEGIPWGLQCGYGRGSNCSLSAAVHHYQLKSGRKFRTFHVDRDRMIVARLPDWTPINHQRNHRGTRNVSL